MINPEMLPMWVKQKFNARAGATVVGAREPLVAYNINLISDDLRLAQILLRNQGERRRFGACAGNRCNLEKPRHCAGIDKSD